MTVDLWHGEVCGSGRQARTESDVSTHASADLLATDADAHRYETLGTRIEPQAQRLYLCVHATRRLAG